MSNSEALVSVIVPVYNVAPYLGRCVNSLIQQLHDQIEVILVNDASTDDSIGIALEMTKRYENVKLVNHDTNKGLSAARNTGISHATGEWICFVDSDDWVENDYISAMVAIATSEHSEIVVCEYDHVWDDGRVETVDSIGNLTSSTDHRIKVALLRNHVVTRLYKRSLFVNTGLRFPEDIKRSEDIAISPALLSYAQRISILPRTLYHYYQRKGSLSNQNRPGCDYGFFDVAVRRMQENMKPGFEKEAEARALMELLYSRPMLQLSTGHRHGYILKEIRKFNDDYPNWKCNPYVSMFPGLKRRFIHVVGAGHLLVAWWMTQLWRLISASKKTKAKMLGCMSNNR